jgi:hypothetical protein
VRKKFKKIKPPKLTAIEKRTVKNLMGLVHVILRQRKARFERVSVTK